MLNDGEAVTAEICRVLEVALAGHPAVLLRKVIPNSRRHH